IRSGRGNFLIDPVFSERVSPVAWMGPRRVHPPPIGFAALPKIDAVLLSHDHHDDNLDKAGRALLPRVGTVITTEAGAKRLGGNARGLAPWAKTELSAEGKPAIEVTATPCRHGPPLSRPLVGDVIGFALRWEGQEHGALWISGDTVLYDGVREVADRVEVGTALIHLGGVRFPATGPVRYTLSAGEAVELLDALRPRTTIPIHYEGWRHFRQGREALEKELAGAPAEVRDRVRWLPIGAAAEVGV
ncbi:MAG TPA: MBL fold metallo-hydrolase, partial [Solirubrobacterales bacterium]